MYGSALYEVVEFVIPAVRSDFSSWLWDSFVRCERLPVFAANNCGDTVQAVQKLFSMLKPGNSVDLAA